MCDFASTYIHHIPVVLMAVTKESDVCEMGLLLLCSWFIYFPDCKNQHSCSCWIMLLNYWWCLDALFVQIYAFV